MLVVLLSTVLSLTLYLNLHATTSVAVPSFCHGVCPMGQLKNVKFFVNLRVCLYLIYVMLRQVLTPAELSDLGFDSITDELPAPEKCLTFRQYIRTRHFFTFQFFFYWTVLITCVICQLKTHDSIPNPTLLVLYGVVELLKISGEIILGNDLLGRNTYKIWDIVGLLSGILSRLVIYCDCVLISVLINTGHPVVGFLICGICFIAYGILVGGQQFRILLALFSYGDTYALHRMSFSSLCPNIMYINTELNNTVFQSTIIEEQSYFPTLFSIIQTIQYFHPQANNYSNGIRENCIISGCIQDELNNPLTIEQSHQLEDLELPFVSCSQRKLNCPTATCETTSSTDNCTVNYSASENDFHVKKLRDIDVIPQNLSHTGIPMYENGASTTCANAPSSLNNNEITDAPYLNQQQVTHSSHSKISNSTIYPPCYSSSSSSSQEKLSATTQLSNLPYLAVRPSLTSERCTEFLPPGRGHVSIYLPSYILTIKLFSYSKQLQFWIPWIWTIISRFCMAVSSVICFGRRRSTRVNSSVSFGFPQSPLHTDFNEPCILSVIQPLHTHHLIDRPTGLTATPRPMFDIFFQIANCWLHNFETEQCETSVKNDKVTQLTNTAQILDCFYLQHILRRLYLTPDALESHEFSAAFVTVGRCFLADILLLVFKVYFLLEPHDTSTLGFVWFSATLSVCQAMFMCLYNTLDEDVWQDILILE